MSKVNLKSVQVGPELDLKYVHHEMQKVRKNDKRDLTLKQFLAETWGDGMTPNVFYQQLGLDLTRTTIDKVFNTSELNRYLLPEIFRDAIRRGLEYTPFFGQLIAAEENIDGTGVTMPMLDLTAVDQNEIRLRDVNEGATITEGELVVWAEKTVQIKKKGRGIKQTYESIAFTPIDLAAIYFEELGTRLGADLDAEFINIALNGDQPANAQSAPVMGAATANTLLYTDIARVWIRFKRIGRSSVAMVMSEADALTVLNMPQFENKNPANGTSTSGVTLNINSPLPTSQDIYVHGSMPTGKILFVDKARGFVQLTALPLLIETDKVISRQLQEEFVSIMTGFANIFRDGRIVLDYTTNLVTNPGPVVSS